MNGKGSRPRPTNGKRYRANYDGINWSSKRTWDPYRCNQCKQIITRPKGPRVRKSFCERTGKEALLYRLKFYD